MKRSITEVVVGPDHDPFRVARSTMKMILGGTVAMYGQAVTGIKKPIVQNFKLETELTLESIKQGDPMEIGLFIQRQLRLLEANMDQFAADGIIHPVEVHEVQLP